VGLGNQAEGVAEEQRIDSRADKEAGRRRGGEMGINRGVTQESLSLRSSFGIRERAEYDRPKSSGYRHKRYT
jgi:hypothetical protein